MILSVSYMVSATNKKAFYIGINFCIKYFRSVFVELVGIAYVSIVDFGKQKDMDLSLLR